MMFWNRKKKPQVTEGPTLQALATKLGVERRFHVRVEYPPQVNVCRLPDIFFEGNKLKVQNISVGGCCLLDPYHVMGAKIGHDIELVVHWATVAETVKARIISGVDDRRHIQFLDLGARRQNQLRKSLVFGVRGSSMIRHAQASELGPTIQAVELWSSPHLDSVVLENDIHRIAQIYVNGEQFMIYREAWPSKSPQGKCGRAEFEQIILFIANIPQPSAALK
jgi:hypothetical protein